MTKRVIKKEIAPARTELTISNQEFKRVLNERMKVGEEILNRQVVSNDDLELMKSDSQDWAEYNAEFLKQCFNNPFNEYRKEYQNSVTNWDGFLTGERKPPLEQQRTVLKNQLSKLNNLITQSELFKSSAISVNLETSKVALNMDEVFIVHGHDDLAKTKTARFIERLGFKPIILHEQASSGNTIIEKIEEHSNVGFGIVLYTPCDLGGKTEDNLKARARQNVVFEHGYLIGKIGRKNVCALVKGNIETPNDISGVVYVNMDDADAWHMQIAKELKSSGYNVDMNILF